MESTNKSYLCKNCGESNIENFYEGRYSSCKKCRNLAKSVSNNITKREKLEPKNLQESFESFLMNNVRVFKGTIYQVITELQDEVKELKIENVILKEKCNNLQEKLIDFEKRFSEFSNKILSEKKE